MIEGIESATRLRLTDGICKQRGGKNVNSLLKEPVSANIFAKTLNVDLIDIVLYILPSKKRRISLPPFKVQCTFHLARLLKRHSKNVVMFEVHNELRATFGRRHLKKKLSGPMRYRK